MTNLCKIDGCIRPRKGRGWCGTHWVRWRKYGDPHHVQINGVDFNVKADCKVEECGKKAHAHKFCIKHLARWRKHGDPHIVGEHTGRPLKGQYLTYAGMHKKLFRERGHASEHSCVACSGSAQEWAYRGGDVRQVQDPKTGSYYSLNLDSYQPMCVSCHRIMDGAGIRERNEKGQFV